jgi:hypothetical protein
MRLDALEGVMLLGASVWRGSVEVGMVVSTGGEVSGVASISVGAEVAPSEAVMSCAVSAAAITVSSDWG